MLRPWFFIVINGLVVIYLIYRLLSSSKRDRPTSLKMDGPDGKSMPNTDNGNTRAGFGSNEKSLNCWFQYNAETWDAFEVLGVPAGATREMCFRAYQDLQRREKTAGPFLEAAWRALEDHFKTL